MESAQASPEADVPASTDRSPGLDERIISAPPASNSAEASPGRRQPQEQPGQDQHGLLSQLFRCLCRGSPAETPITNRSQARRGQDRGASSGDSRPSQNHAAEAERRQRSQGGGATGSRRAQQGSMRNVRGQGQHQRPNSDEARIADLLEQLELAREVRELEVALHRSMEGGQAGGDATGEPRANDELTRMMFERLLAQDASNGDSVAQRLLLQQLLQRGGAHHRLLGAGANGQDDASLQDAINRSRRQHLIQELPREKYCKERYKDLVECELCLCDYEVDDELMRLPCMHLFHSGCVAPWLEKNMTCPVCQTDACEAAGI